MLRIFDEVNYSVTIEALGDDEKGTDVFVTTMKGEKEHQQCKARNGSKDKWDISDLRAKGIFKTWEFQLNRGDERRVALVSPMTCSFLVDLHSRSLNTSGDSRDFYYAQINESGKEFQKFYADLCAEMNLKIFEENGILL